MIEREADIAARHGEALHGIEAGGILRPRGAQELAPRRDLVEQPFDANSRAGRQGCRPLAGLRAVIHLDSPAVGTPQPAFQCQPGHAGDRGQRLAAKAEARHPIDRVLRQL